MPNAQNNLETVELNFFMSVASNFFILAQKEITIPVILFASTIPNFFKHRTFYILFCLCPHVYFL